MTMSRLSVTLACGPYDRMSALFNGSVQVEGVDLRCIPIQQPMEVFSRMLKNQEFDISEMSLTHCFTLRAANKARFVTLPVFPSRMFRHGFIFINSKSGIRSPKDLQGKRIGVQGYQMTAAVWIRGILRSEYGVSFEGTEWLEGGVNEPGVPGGDATSMRPGQKLNIRHVGNTRTLSDMLAAGEIDAIIGAIRPTSLATSPDVVRLFPNYHEVEREYYRRTGVFPGMHALVIRDEVYQENRWLATSVFKACNAAKIMSLEQAQFTGALQFMLPWLTEALEEIDEVFGGDPWPYGLGPNRRMLDAFNQILVDDGFLPAPLKLEDVFVPIEGLAP
jgi:4,5-dihydroxyphthalate decarboxylase